MVRLVCWAWQGRVGPVVRVSRDHTEFMVLALPLDDVYRESILGIASQNALAGEGLAVLSPSLVSTGFSVLPGFAP